MIINIKKSFILNAVVFGTHSGALLLVLALPIVLVLKCGLAALIGASFWWQFRYGAGASACQISLDEDGTCVRMANSEQRRYRIARATAHAGFVRLVLMLADMQTRIQLVPRDAVEPEVYRDLRARIMQRRLPVPERDPI